MAEIKDVEEKISLDPFELYRKHFLPAMLSIGFEFVSDQIDATRIYSRFVQKRKIYDNALDSPNYNKMVDSERNVEVIGIPAIPNTLLLHGLAINPKVDTSEVRVKIRSSMTSDEIDKKIYEELIRPLFDMISVNLCELPKEVKLKVLSYLPLASVNALSSVNLEWNNLAEIESVWKNLTKRYYPKEYELFQKGKFFFNKSSD